jgi:periplasmic divalent cation tolerance protein
MSEYVSLYVTCANREQARDIAHTLLEQKLIACANIMEGVTSLYRWLGELQQDTETVFIAKTRKDKVDAAMETIRKLHTYECPCMVAWPIVDGNPTYLKWVDEQLAD